VFPEGGGDMGAVMRALDWKSTPVGLPAGWPQSLRTAVGLLLESRFPMLLCWGPDFIQFYNDPFRPILGATKHPAMGRSARDTFAEAWHIVGPLFDRVMAGDAVGFEDMLVPLDRYGFLEECYFTYSYSPIRAEAGDVAGVFVTCTETTGRVIGERRLRLLQELSAVSTAGGTAGVCRGVAEVLARGATDVPFAELYLLDPDGTTLRRAAAAGAAAGDVLAPAGPDGAARWPLQRALDTGALLVADDPASPSGRAFVTPVFVSPGAAAGVLVAGAGASLPIDERYSGFITLVARDIGTSLAAAGALEEEKRRAESLAALDRAKTTFFSNISHEFRTPLTLMLGPLEQALDSANPALRGDQLAVVHRNALRLLKLVNALLDFSKIESGAANPAFEPTDLRQLTQDLASTFRSAMSSAGLDYEIHCAVVPADVAVDRDAWEKIVLNLLSNALKFTFHGRIRLSLHQRGDRIELEVQDTGVGIPEAEIPRLFDRFHRVHGTSARTHEGSGIGLTLVNELAHVHGGTLRVASVLGRGSTFTVSLPAQRVAAGAEARGHPPAATPEAAARPYLVEALRWLPSTSNPEPSLAAVTGHATSAAAAPTILVADDNLDMRQYLVRLLSDRWIVHEAADGTAALAAARVSQPALIISDVMMPGLDGFALVRALRSDAATRHIPIILLSARAGEEASIEGLEAGADDYIVKPFSARELRARVEAQLLRAEIRTIEGARDRQLAEMFRHAPVAVAVLRGAGHVIEYVNEQYMAVVGRRELVGRRLLDAVPELLDQESARLLDRVYASGEPYTAEAQPVTLNRGPHGAAEQAYFNFVYQPMRNRGTEVDGIAVIAVDVTELARARHDAEAADRAKDQFLAVLGHELRNPLAPILTAVRLLELKGPPDPALQRLRQTIARQARQMLKLVEDLLDVGRIMTGKLRLEKRLVDIGTLAREAVDACQPFIESRRHTATLTAPDWPLRADVDAARITQVLCNLLNNAAKFMPDGGRIELAVDEEAGSVRVRVRDHGVGIPADMLERVFDRFVQADVTDDRRSDGLGIGLSLVKTMVELHGGTVVARSDGPGMGSEFTVSLPAAPVPAAAT
jgi:PAS domain S-box-containing protein